MLPHTCQNGHHQLIYKQVLGRMRRKGNPRAQLVGMQTGAATAENSVEFSQIIKMELPFNPMIPFLGIYPKMPKTLIGMNICIPMFTAVLFIIAKIWKQPKCPSVMNGSKSCGTCTQRNITQP